MDYRVLPLGYGGRTQSPGENDIGTGGGDIAPDILIRDVIRRRPQDENRLTDPGIPQFDRLIGRRDGETPASRLEKRPRDPNGSMTVRIRLDYGE